MADLGTNSAKHHCKQYNCRWFNDNRCRSWLIYSSPPLLGATNPWLWDGCPAHVALAILALASLSLSVPPPTPPPTHPGDQITIRLLLMFGILPPFLLLGPSRKWATSYPFLRGLSALCEGRRGRLRYLSLRTPEGADWSSLTV